MFKPRFATSHTLVPILSKDAINDIGERLVEDFCPQAMTTPTEIDVDRFITRYLGLEQDFQYLSHCGVFLGMTVFNDTDRVPVFNPDRWEAKYIPVKAGTVIIDNILLEENQEHRYRFTCGHEAAHSILHAEYFKAQAKKAQLSGNGVQMVQCRRSTAQYGKGCRAKTDSDWLEWQANQLASAILMPKSMVIAKVREAKRIYRNNVNAPMQAVAETFNVSNDAAFYRLQDLGLLPR